MKQGKLCLSVKYSISSVRKKKGFENHFLQLEGGVDVQSFIVVLSDECTYSTFFALLLLVHEYCILCEFNICCTYLHYMF